MSSALNVTILNQKGTSTTSRPSIPGSPTYIGGVDYPNTVYQGYIGSSGYIYEPRAVGYDIIDKSNIPLPIARMPKTTEFKELNLRTATEPLFGECAIPSFFQTSEDVVRNCNQKSGIFLFYISLALNCVTVLTLHSRVTYKFLIYFILFHIFLYYFLTRIFVNISIIEWNTFQRYRYTLKKNIEIAINDSLIKQFDDIIKDMKNQILNRRSILSLTLIASFLGICIPLLFIKERT
jgi:hypothetical protein